MQEIYIGDERLSVVGASLRKIRAEAAKVIEGEMKRIKGLVLALDSEQDLNTASQLAARAVQHVDNAVAVSSTVGIPVLIVHDTRRLMFHCVMEHPLYQESAELLQLCAKLATVETNPNNWA